MNFFAKTIAFFEGLVETNPSAQDVLAHLKAAETAAETALPTLATTAANAALALLPLGLGADLDPLADEAIDGVIAILEGKKSTAAPAAPAAPAVATTFMAPPVAPVVAAMVGATPAAVQKLNAGT